MTTHAWPQEAKDMVSLKMPHALWEISAGLHVVLESYTTNDKNAVDIAHYEHNRAQYVGRTLWWIGNCKCMADIIGDSELITMLTLITFELFDASVYTIEHLAELKKEFDTKWLPV